MRPIKNKKRIDPRYFMDEKTDLQEGRFSDKDIGDLERGDPKKQIEKTVQAAEKMQDSPQGQKIIDQGLKDPRILKQLEKIASELPPELIGGLKEGEGEGITAQNVAQYLFAGSLGAGAFISAIPVLAAATGPVGAATSGAGALLAMLVLYLQKQTIEKEKGVELTRQQMVADVEAYNEQWEADRELFDQQFPPTSDPQAKQERYRAWPVFRRERMEERGEEYSDNARYRKKVPR